ncbi:MAG: hypothetical protein EOO54_08395 [Haliea sp.]|nr:MAG: hypothetical protein EOO54_08395 [Haliea sp.]
MPPSPAATIQASLRQRCPDLQSLEGTTGADVMRWALAAVRDYRVCQDRHGRLVEAVTAPAESKRP